MSKRKRIILRRAMILLYICCLFAFMPLGCAQGPTGSDILLAVIVIVLAPLFITPIVWVFFGQKGISYLTYIFFGELDE